MELTLHDLQKLVSLMAAIEDKAKDLPQGPEKINLIASLGELKKESADLIKAAGIEIVASEDEGEALESNGPYVVFAVGCAC